MKTWKTPQLRALAKAFSHMHDTKEVLNFLRDLCTVDELEELSERFEIAKRLSNGESYRSIAEHVGKSTTTVSRVAHWLKHGEGGYLAALKKSEK
ncbi:helix-turn-helix domain-containing protein [Candidatus Nomurabacteria bacterium]|nr:helix-turn-helix domain-containing protein [Candidatus Nomurabacteria bacterium]